MKLDPILTKAVRLARKKDYDGAIRTLEVEATRYYGSATYYYLLGLAYLHLRVFGRSLSYMKLAYEQRMRDPNILLCLAALYLNHGDTDRALNLYLEVLSIQESNRIAKKALKIIRKYPGPENISIWIDSGSLSTLFPPFPRMAVPEINIGRLFAAMAVGLGIIFGVFLFTGILSAPERRGSREIPHGIILAPEERDSPLQFGGSHRFWLSETDVINTYNEAVRLFSEHRDEAARFRLNRILESNASEAIKNRARLLISYMETPGFHNLQDRFSYSEVILEPFLFRDVYVIWRGLATNIEVGQTYTSFDFLVGFDTRQTLEGIVHVHYDFAIPVNPEHPVEILGRVIPISSAPGIRIQGVSLNQARLLER